MPQLPGKSGERYRRRGNADLPAGDGGAETFRPQNDGTKQTRTGMELERTGSRQRPARIPTRRIEASLRLHETQRQQAAATAVDVRQSEHRSEHKSVHRNVRKASDA